MGTGTDTDHTDPVEVLSKRTCTQRAIVLLPLLSWFAVATAETLNFGVDAGIGETDNVTLAHDDKISQTIAVTDVDFDYLEKSRRLDVDATGKFSYLDYLQNAYGNQLVGRFDGNASLALIPQRLTWVLQDDFGQGAINPFSPTTPTNLENINTVTTGPDLYLRLGGASFIDINARVGHAQYGSSQFSNSRGTGSFAWGLKLSSLSSVSVNGDTQRVLFENTFVNTDFDRTNAFARYEVTADRTELLVDLGATSVGERGGSTTGGLAKFKLARKLSSASRLTFSVGRETIDSSASFGGLQAGATGVVGPAPASNTSENYADKYASISWEYQRNRTTLSLSDRWERNIYPGEGAFNRTINTGEMRLQRLMTRAFVLDVTGRIYKTDYANTRFAHITNVNSISPSGSPTGSPNASTSTISAALTWHHGRALEVKLACEHTNYTTSPDNTSYRENRLLLTVGYRPSSATPNGEALPSM